MGKYNVLLRIWHTKDERYYDDGDNVSLTHLADFQIERLIAQGVIEPVGEGKKKKNRPPAAHFNKTTRAELSTSEKREVK